MVYGRAFKPSQTDGRPAVLISARGGNYAPGAPNHGLDYVVPTTEAVLGREDQPGLNVATMVPELTMTPHAPSRALLLPKHVASLADAPQRARRLAATIAAPNAA